VIVLIDPIGIETNGRRPEHFNGCRPQ
jgi:hypothetical protein